MIWAANLLHGGKKIIDQSRTRFSQVIHYHFENVILFTILVFQMYQKANML